MVVSDEGKNFLYSVVGSESLPTIHVYKSCIAGTCKCVHLIDGKPAQLLPCRFAPFLSGSSNVLTDSDEDCQFIWEGVVQGFKIVNKNCETGYNCKNYNSILQKPFFEEMCNLIEDETISGKVSVTEIIPKCVHSLGGVEKSNGDLRPITDCSMPRNFAINNFMQETYRPFTYNSVNTAVKMLEKGDFMSVLDLRSAYRSVNVYGKHSTFQGFAWKFKDGKKQYYTNNRLSFGLRCAPYIFSKLSDLIVLIANSYGVGRVVNYLDDFLVIGSSEDECRQGRDVLIQIVQHLGFEVAFNKVTDPNTTFTFLGITIDSLEMDLTLPVEKLDK